MHQADSNIFRAAFLADALTLGPHWVYDQEKIARLYPDGITVFDEPRSSYHPNRKKGQFTHYGDQMMMVARAVAAAPDWSLPVFRSVWQSGMTAFDGYVDGASKTTLANLAAGSPDPASDSNDLAGASRFAPTLFPSNKTLRDKIRAAREQAALTHGDGTVIDAAEFFVRATVALQKELSIPDAFQQSAEANYENLPAKDWLTQATEALRCEDYLKAAADFGLTCHIPEAFPATLYFALRWHRNGAGTSESDFLTALSKNSLAGGDTSARAIPLAVFLAAAGCRIPNDLWEQLDAHESLSTLEKLIAPPH